MKRKTPINGIKINRPEKGGSLRREGKKEKVWGRNFCLPALLSLGLAHTSHTRRPKGGGRRGRELPRKLFHLVILLFKMSPNFYIEGQPNGLHEPFLAGEEGFEPPMLPPEGSALPLGDSPLSEKSIMVLCK